MGRGDLGAVHCIQASWRVDGRVPHLTARSIVGHRAPVSGCHLRAVRSLGEEGLAGCAVGSTHTLVAMAMAMAMAMTALLLLHRFGKQVLFGFGVAEKNAKAMRAFLLCLQTLTQAIEAREGARIVDYSMQGGSIGGLPFNEVGCSSSSRSRSRPSCLIEDDICLRACS